MGREDEIRLIAYTIWEQEGRHDRSDLEYWFRAESMWEDQNRKITTKSIPIVSKQADKQNLKLNAKKKQKK